jgi:hypothetical protein
MIIHDENWAEIPITCYIIFHTIDFDHFVMYFLVYWMRDCSLIQDQHCNLFFMQFFFMLDSSF